ANQTIQVMGLSSGPTGLTVQSCVTYFDARNGGGACSSQVNTAGAGNVEIPAPDFPTHSASDYRYLPIRVGGRVPGPLPGPFAGMAGYVQTLASPANVGAAPMHASVCAPYGNPGAVPARLNSLGQLTPGTPDGAVNCPYTASAPPELFVDGYSAFPG